MKTGGSPASQLVGWITSCPQRNVYFQNKNLTPATYSHFPRIASDGKVGIQTNPTARGFRHLVLPQRQAGGCLQKGWPQNVTKVPVNSSYKKEGSCCFTAADPSATPCGAGAGYEKPAVLWLWVPAAVCAAGLNKYQRWLCAALEDLEAVCRL